MQDILGSICSNQEELDTFNTSSQQNTSLFSNIANFFRKPKDESEKDGAWQEFPWEQVIVKTDIIAKWKKVDMKKIHKLHANFDLDTAKFINLDQARLQQQEQ